MDSSVRLGPPFYVIATPIGNLADISLRAIEALKETRVIVCEDTRVTLRLLSHLGIHGKTLLSLHHEDAGWVERMCASVSGRPAALVVDNGTPAISDPGARLLRALTKNGARVIAIPGASALTAALSISGMGRDGFIFLGFLPKSRSKIVKELTSAFTARDTVVFYESPHRIKDTLAILAELKPLADVLVARELTKIHEEISRADAVKMAADYASRQRVLGEITVIAEDPGEPRQD
ncbi:MAG: 16S rRNA (cytidine(1402)-2'-O)-methyltransferase [Elusimicrobiota bacterium]